MSIKKPTKAETELLVMLEKLCDWYLVGLASEYYGDNRGDWLWKDANKLLSKWGIQ